jgi:UDP-glucose 4-epimerase
MNRILITGGAGFIGSHLVDKLIEEGNKVIVLDNLSTGKREFIQRHFQNPRFSFHRTDLLTENIEKYFKGVNEVWHLAANPDTRTALKNTRVDIDQNILVTYKILEAMRKNNVKRIIFTSSSTVYGEAKTIPTPENHPCRPISLYGASKLACESLISAYVHTFNLNAAIFRLANIIGPRMTHGAIHDFIQKLRRNPSELKVLGDGNQRKSYMYIEDCVEGMILASREIDGFEIFNLGSEDQIILKEIVKIVCKEMHLNPKIKFSDANRGWKGDVPVMLLDITKIKKLGFKPKHNSRKAVELTVKLLLRRKMNKDKNLQRNL